MIYAQIKDNKIINSIVIDDETPMELFSKGYDYFIRIDNLNPTPGIGWSYIADNEFSPPPTPPDPEQQEN